MLPGLCCELQRLGRGGVRGRDPPGRPKHTFRRDERNRVTAYVAPDVGPGDETTTFSYDRDGRLASMRKPGQEPITIVRDGGGRVARLDTKADVWQYEYQPGTGQVSSILAPGGVTTAYAYDGPYPTSTTWTGPVAGRHTVTWNADGRPAQDDVDGVAPITYSYDRDLLSVRAGDLSITRDIAGRVDRTTLGDLTTDDDHNAFGEQDRSVAARGATTLYDTRYSRDLLGRVTRREETILGVTRVFDYEYDVANRLSRVLVDGSEQARYTYDLNGNRTTDGDVSATYDDQDRLLTRGNVSYITNAAGEVVEKRAPGAVTTYTYNALGSLGSVDLPDGTTIDYIFDGQQRRIGTTVDGHLVGGLLYAGQLTPVAEVAPDGSIRSRFVYGTRATVPDYLIRSGQRYRLVTDHLGSVRLVVDVADGTVAQRLDYDPFGRVLVDTNPGFQPFGFAGGLYDHRTGLVRFGFRDYDPEAGRWTQPDPLLFGGGQANLYAYANNDPINRVDQAGLCPSTDISHVPSWTLTDWWATLGGIAGALLAAGRAAFTPVVVQYLLEAAEFEIVASVPTYAGLVQVGELTSVTTVAAGTAPVAAGEAAGVAAGTFGATATVGGAILASATAGYLVGTIINHGLDSLVFGRQGLGGWLYDKIQ